MTLNVVMALIFRYFTEFVYILHCQSRTEPRPPVTRTENFVKFGHVVFEIMRADRRTETLIAVFCTHTTGGDAKNNRRKI